MNTDDEMALRVATEIDAHCYPLGSVHDHWRVEYARRLRVEWQKQAADLSPVRAWPNFVQAGDPKLHELLEYVAAAQAVLKTPPNPANIITKHKDETGYSVYEAWARRCATAIIKYAAPQLAQDCVMVPRTDLEKFGQIEGKYNQLIMAVAKKWPGETRHQTALRYILQCERPGADRIVTSAKEKS